MYCNKFFPIVHEEILPALQNDDVVSRSGGKRPDSKTCDQVSKSPLLLPPSASLEHSPTSLSLFTSSQRSGIRACAALCIRFADAYWVQHD